MKTKATFYLLLMMLVFFLVNNKKSFGEDGFYVIAGSNVINTQLFTSNSIDSTLGTGAWTKLPSPSWTYNKKRSNSKLIITYQDMVNSQSTGFRVCGYQIRVDDLVNDGGQSAGVINCSTDYTNAYSSTGVWSDIPAGNVEISIWHRQVLATDCNRNSGGYTTSVIVMEVGR